MTGSKAMMKPFGRTSDIDARSPGPSSIWSSVTRPTALSMSSGSSAPEPQKIWRMYSAWDRESGSWAAMRRMRGLTVKVTSISWSSVGSWASAQSEQKYSCRLMVFSAPAVSSTPPQPGQSTFHDMSSSPSRAAWTSAPIVASSSRPLLGGESQRVDAVQRPVRRGGDRRFQRLGCESDPPSGATDPIARMLRSSGNLLLAVAVMWGRASGARQSDGAKSAGGRGEVRTTPGNRILRRHVRRAARIFRPAFDPPQTRVAETR